MSNKSRKQPAQALSAQVGIQTTSTNHSASSQKAHAAFISADPEAAYNHFLAEAQAIPAGSERLLTVEPTLLRHNAEKGVAFFSTIEADIVKEMPAFPVARMLEIPTIALATLFAYDQVVERASDGEIAARLSECAKLRSPMLKMLEVLADPEVGLCDAEIVKDIRQGTGAMDKARDAVKIAAYFRKLGAAIEGKHPFTSEQINTLAEHGHWLIPQLTPQAAKSTQEARDPAAVRRNQFYTLLTNRYERLRGAVAAIRGVSGLDDLVPPLGARSGSARKAANGASPEAVAADTKSAPSASPAAPSAPVK